MDATQASRLHSCLACKADPDAGETPALQDAPFSLGVGPLGYRTDAPGGHPNGDTLSRRGRRLEHVPVLCPLLRSLARGVIRKSREPFPLAPPGCPEWAGETPALQDAPFFVFSSGASLAGSFENPGNHSRLPLRAALNGQARRLRYKMPRSSSSPPELGSRGHSEIPGTIPACPLGLPWQGRPRIARTCVGSCSPERATENSPGQRPELGIVK